MKDLNVYPYYDNSEDEYLKNYKQILSVPGRAVQARELSGVQTLNHLQGIENWNTVYKHGSVVDGCDITIITTDKTYAKVSTGKFYYDGRILLVPEQSIEIAGIGTENLGFYIEETFVTYNGDNTLLDRASGVANYGLPGADRLKIEVIFIIVKDVVAEPRPELEDYEKYEDVDGVNKIWNLIDGIVQNYIRKPDYSLISKTLAQRTFHQAGHYLVEGMNLQTELANVDDEITITITPGICYVYGYDNIFIVNKSVDVSKSLDLKQYLNEPHTFSTGTYIYELIYPYTDLDSSITITSIIRKTIQITRGSGDYDTFEDMYGVTYTSIESIIEIPGYTVDTDYELLNDQVHWLGGGSRPGGGVDYDITFRYYKNSVRDVDFTVLLDPYQTLDIYYVSWLGVDDPDNDTNFLVDYSTFLARTDLVAIDKDGNIIVKAGSPTLYDETKIPAFGNDTLPIGWIKFLPGKDWDSCIIYEYNFRRSTMFDLHYLRERVDTLEENVAYLALEREVKEGEDTTLMTGLFVDAFENLYRSNVEHEDYNIATNLLQGQILLKSTEIIYTLDRSDDTLTDIKTYTDNDSIKIAYSMNYTSTNCFFEQKLKSDTMNLNPYGFILNLPVSKLNPASDSWVETEVKEKVIVQNKVTETTTNIHQLQWVSLPNNVNQLTSQKLTSVGEKVSNSKTNIAEKLITLARNITITVYGKNFEPLSKVTCVCGGIYAPLTAVSPYVNEKVGGISTGKIIVGANGLFIGTFVVPQKVKSGNIEVQFIDSNKNISKVVFRSKGIQKIIENQTLITRNFTKTIDVYNILPPNKSNQIEIELPDEIEEVPKAKPALNTNIQELTKDPLAQSFIFKDDKVIISIDLWFGTKADDNAKPVVPDDYYNSAAFQPTLPAILTIGFMKNGFPDETQIIHYQEIYPDEITTSIYGTTATNIELSKPVFIPALKDFYISIGSKSTEYTVFVAVMSEKDIETQNVIMKQAYQDGSLFASSNGITWTAVQEKDLAIRLYEGVYSTETASTILIENVEFPYSTWTGYGRFLFMNDYIEPPRTKIYYYYSTDTGSTWNLFNPADEIALSFLGTELQIKAELYTEVENLTPIVELDNNLIFFKYDISEQGQYRTLPVEDIPAFNSVKLILDESNPSGTSIFKEFSNDGSVWFRLVQDAIDSRDIGKNFYKNIYLFEFDLLQKLSVTLSTGFAVGDAVKFVGSGTNTAKITAISGNDVYVLLNDDGETRFNASHQLTNGTTTKDIDSVEDYTSEPTWPTDWTGRILMESSSVFKSPVVMNYRSIMKII